MMQDPRWISRAFVEALHHDQLQSYGGRYGVRDENLLESALGRPRQKWAYEEGVDVFDLAAAYAFGIAKDHPFIDGNKRTAFAVMTLFLRLNGHLIHASEPDAIIAMLGVAAGELGEPELAAWCRQRGVPVSE